MTVLVNSCVSKSDKSNTQNILQSNLQHKIESIISTKKGTIGVSIIGPNTLDTVLINGHKMFPMLSTFKFPIALTVLHKVEIGELSMQQQVFIKKEELLQNTWSPFREKYPEGNVSISLENAINWMVDYSDNNMTDILLRLIGGTDQVEKFLNNKNFIIKNNEVDMHKDWESQFINKATPSAFTSLLKNFSEGKILNKENTAWLYKAMVSSKTGIKRLKGKLPNVVIAQRAGTSFTNDEGITGAINNVGVIELPNKHKIFIAVFIQNTSEEFEKGEEIIADIAKATYDYYAEN